MDKLIISVGINGGELSRADTPYLPLTTDEIIESVVGVHAAGGAVAHVHVRDARGRPSQDLGLYRAVVDGVRERCDIILNLTTDIRRRGGDATLGLAPELASFPGGSVNYGDSILEARLPKMRELAERTREFSVKPELEIFHEGMIQQCLQLAEEGLLDDPLYFQFLLGLDGGAPPDARSLIRLVDSLPSGSLWGVAGIGTRAGIDMVMLGMLLGGHVRVGIEDHPEYLPGRLATSNAELVDRVARLAGEYGREIATPDEARAMLGIETDPAPAAPPRRTRARQRARAAEPQGGVR
ncbi:MAG TPA: 3-keto-5-aminohexanoate cleavage protein [Miltoncostaeaceae bacterium]|jgi:3-keto-5-aminohexanoate cleavage enzyme|nr:3-keto-5-aminohexanoate cleavage protein [Miltoncostaeaceae bacterium]